MRNHLNFYITGPASCTSPKTACVMLGVASRAIYTMTRIMDSAKVPKAISNRVRYGSSFESQRSPRHIIHFSPPLSYYLCRCLKNQLPHMSYIT